MSAGGIAVNSWTNYVKDFVGDHSKVFSIADSGVFITFDPISGRVGKSSFENLFTLSNVDEASPSAECNQHYPGEEWKCWAIEIIYPYIKGRYMIINSEYDAYTIPNILKIKCLKNGTSGETLSKCNKTELDYIEKYRAAYKQTLNKFVAINPDLSIWSIACSKHVYACYKDFYDSPHQKIPANTGKTVRDAVEEFVFHGTKNVLFDAEGWPSNTGCAM